MNTASAPRCAVRRGIAVLSCRAPSSFSRTLTSTSTSTSTSPSTSSRFRSLAALTTKKRAPRPIDDDGPRHAYSHYHHASSTARTHPSYTHGSSPTGHPSVVVPSTSWSYNRPPSDSYSLSLTWTATAAALVLAGILLINTNSPLHNDQAPVDLTGPLPRKLRKLAGQEIAKHNSIDDCWVCIDSIVYDVTDFLAKHPAGAEAIVEHGGKDITVLFQKLHPRGTLEHVLNASHVVGETDEAFPPALAEVEDDEDELEEKRAKLPPVGTVVALSEFEAMAKLVLGENSRAWNYIFSYSDDGASFFATKDSFKYVRFLPRVAVPVGQVDPSVELLGGAIHSPLPVLIGPTGQNRSAHPDGELNSLYTSHKTGIVQGMSNGASVSLEELLEERAELARRDSKRLSPFWWQIYIRTDRAINEKQVSLAAKGKVDAIILTVDVPALGNRASDKHHPERPKAAALQDVPDELVPLPTGAIDPNVSWDDVAWIKERAPGVPVIVKGVATVDDVELALKAGASGVVLSNHGARQLDYAPPPLAVLVRLQRERPDLLKAFDVYIDGGISRGTDVLKAVCLGAKGVLIGRTPMYAMACYGEAGVKRALQILSDEIYTGMRLLGARNISELTPEMVEILPGLVGEQARSRRA